uniref:Uncharacterized LOC115147726 n=1 Tax=Salmo trutta TaxID=8032 RepID=A0A673YEU7_SALTR
MDGFREVAASEKERKPAGEESEEPSSELPSTSSGMLTPSGENHRRLETEISRMKVKLEVLKQAEFNIYEKSATLPRTSSRRSTLYAEERDLEFGFMKRTLDVPALLMTTLEELTEQQLKTFQSNLTTFQLSGFPPIPESQLENVDRQDTVDQMVKRYGPERAVEITVKILMRMNLDDLAEKLVRFHTRGSPTASYKSLVQPRPIYSAKPPLLSSSPSFLHPGSSNKLSSISGSSGQLSSQRPQILAVPTLLLTTLEELTEEQLKTFQSNLTSGWMLGFPPIPESQLENVDRQVTVDQMVKSYGPYGAVRNTLKILTRMNLDDLAEKLVRFHTRAVSITETKWWSDSSDTGSVKEKEKKRVHLAGSSRALDREAAGSKDTGITKDKYELVTKPTEKKREALLLATLEELSTDELKIFQQELTPSKQLSPYLTAFPPIPETQLENTDRQVTVDQMVERYGPERAVEITVKILMRMNLDDLAEKLVRFHTRGSPTASYMSLVQPRPIYSAKPPLLSSSPSFLHPGSSNKLSSISGNSGQLSSQRPQILAVPALLLTTLEELTEEQLKTFQSNLTSGWMLGFPPIPESQLENVDRQVTVDQMVKSYGPYGAVRNTLKILTRMNLDDLAEKLVRFHTRGNITIMYINLYITITVQCRSKPEEAGWRSNRRTGSL